MATLKVTNIKNESFAGDQLYLKTDGKIGIGTTSPNHLLHVEGALSGTTGFNLTNTHASGYGLYVKGGGTGNYAFRVDNQAGSEALRIVDGKVGINTISPASKLQVAGSIHVTASADSLATDALQFSFSSPEGHIKVKNTSGAPAGNLAFHTTDASGNTNRVMHLKYDGKVGIGTTSPTETLHVYQSAVDNVNVLLEQGNTNSGNLIQFKQITTGPVTRTAYIGHGGDATGQLMIQNSGNIYLQTGGSTTALTIDATQNSTFEGWVHLKDNKALYIGSANDLSLFHDATDCRIRYNHAVGSLKFQKNDNSDVMVLDGSGRLGIGITSTSEKLQVHGAIRSSSNSADWGAGSEGFFADYYAAGNMVRLGHVNGASGSAKHIRFYSGGVSQFELNTNGATIARRGVNFPNPNNTGAEITAAILKLGSDNLQLQERYPNGAYADRCDLVIRTNSGYGGGQSDKVRFRAGGGICFGTDTASANALDDYEEGVWTPVPSFNSGTTGMTYQYAPTGVYTKIGRVVTVRYGFSWTSKGSSTGAFKITGLPFNATHSAYNHFVGPTITFNGPNADGNMMAYVSTSTLNFRMYNEANANVSPNENDFDNDTKLMGTMTYMV